MPEAPATYEQFLQMHKDFAPLIYNPINYAYFWFRADNMVYCFAHESPSKQHGVPEERWVHYNTYTLQEFIDEVNKRGLRGVNLAGW